MLCGHCDRTIAKGTVYQRWMLCGVTKPRIRCLDCAEGTPQDQPEPAEPEYHRPIGLDFTRLGDGKLTRDHVMRHAGRTAE